MNKTAACREARDVLAAPPSDSYAAARVAAHRSRCADCRAYAAHIEATASAVRAAAGPGLDDVARARVTARLALALDELATRNAHRQQRPRGGAFLGPAAACAAVCAVAALVLLVQHLPPKERPLAQHAEVVAPSLKLPPPPVTPLPPPPRALAAEAAPELFAGRLAVPAGAVVHATVDRYTWLTVIGPAQLVVESVSPRVSLLLQSGLLLGEYEHHAGGSLRVRSPGTTTLVVGTIFAVQALSATQSRVAVRRGAVEVRSRGETVHLRAGWSWESGEAARPEIPAALEIPLAAHAASHPGAAKTPARPPSVGPAAAPKDALAQAESSPAVAPLTPSPATAPDGGSAAPGAGRSSPEAASGAAPGVAAPPRAEDPPAATAESLYAQAEAAMRDGNRAAVRANLTAVIRRFPEDGLADAALYELARLEQADGQPAKARLYLDRLLAHDCVKELREPARYLRCRLDIEAHPNVAAATCLTAFRADYPASPHDAEVLALLIGLLQAGNDCARVLPLLDEYAHRYPHGTLDLKARRARCVR